MLLIPTRTNLSAIAASTASIGSPAAFGICRRIDGDRAALLHWYAQGLSEWVLPVGALPAVLRFGADSAPRQSDVDTLGTPSLQQFLRDTGAARVASAVVPSPDHETRFWMASPNPSPFSDDQLAVLSAAATAAAPLLTTSAAEDAERLRRLEMAAGVLPTLLEALDVRDVFDHMSKAAQPALPHDALVAVLFSDDLATYSVFAVSGSGIEFSPNQANAYAPSVIRVYRFSIVDDLLAHSLERLSFSARLGGRSTVRAPIRYRDRVIGSLTFISNTINSYNTADAPIAIRLAEQVAIGLSHYHLAEDARRAEQLRQRAANLDLLDDLLNTVAEGSDIAQVFERVSAAVSKLLPHDGATLAVRIPDSNRGRAYASAGFPPGLAETFDVPEDLLRNPNWDADIFDDLGERTEQRYRDLAGLGFRSMVRVPIRGEGQLAAALLFLSNTRAAFAPDDVAVARRVADRLSVTLARDRELAASRRADQASERASQLEARVRALTDELNARSGFRRVVGESKPWRDVLTQATQVAPTPTTVLLLGESGTGKEVVARLLHRGSPRGGAPFIALNCAALPEQLLEAELFGFERGAFTGAMQSKPGQLELASGGTLFLDEVGEMSPPAQAKFLRVLQEREFQRLGGTRVVRTDARIVAATNRDLPRDIANGKFREDLYYRLNVFAIRLPALRDRRDDILLLSEEFLLEIGKGLGRPPGGISRDARQRLIDYHWPGNVRELRNILERAAILCDGGLITAEHLAITPALPPPAQSQEPTPPAPLPPALPATSDLSTVEKALIEQALEGARFNKSKAAKALGLTRHQLYIRMRRHGLE
jgi:transcriptional regulator with GAF, ATPase, and Fis domain